MGLLPSPVWLCWLGVLGHGDRWGQQHGWRADKGVGNQRFPAVTSRSMLCSSMSHQNSAGLFHTQKAQPWIHRSDLRHKMETSNGCSSIFRMGWTHSFQWIVWGLVCLKTRPLQSFVCISFHRSAAFSNLWSSRWKPHLPCDRGCNPSDTGQLQF